MRYFFTLPLALLLLCLSWSVPAVAQTPRRTVMLNAKNLVVTTNKGATYYYLVTQNAFQRLTLSDGNVEICDDVFALSDIKSIRYRSLPRFFMDEDSTTFNRTLAVDNGLLGLRRSMTIGKWNSLLLPVALTKEQVLDAFGEGTQVVRPRGINEADATIVELETIDMTDLKPSDIVIKAHYHFLVCPTREPDVASGTYLYSFVGSTRVPGPIYLIPSVSLEKYGIVRGQTFFSQDQQRKVVFRGTYAKLTDAKRVPAGTYMLNDEGVMVMNEEPAEVKAFTTWLEAVTPDGQPFTFYLDGELLKPNSIADLRLAEPADASADDGIYDLGGRRVGTMPADRSRLKPGLYVIQGRKVIVK